MRRCNLPRASFVAALVLGPAHFALAGASPEEEARRLADHVFLVGELKRGWEPLLADMGRSLDSLAEAPPESVRPVRVTVDAARETYANVRRPEGEAGETRALALFDLLARSAVDEARRPSHHQSCADIYMARARRADAVGDEAHDAVAFDCAKDALRHVRGLEDAFRMIARLGLKVGRASKDREEYDAALEKLGATIETLRENGVPAGSQSLVDVNAVMDDIRRTTGELRIAWLGDPKVLAAVKGGRTDFTGAALAFSGAGKAPPPYAAGGKRRIRTGTWQVTATGRGRGEPLTRSVTVDAKGGEITLVAAVPDGMVVVEPPDGTEPFLIDETEWTTEQYAAVMEKAPTGAPNLPAAPVTFEEAVEAARRAGKEIPTFEQWSHAAFRNPADRSRPYPWDGAAADASRHFAGAGEREPAGSRPEGRSWCGCQDMAGSCWEWIRHRGRGWLIGGGWKQSTLSRGFDLGDGTTAVFDYLRDPLPTLDTYDNAFTDTADLNKYRKYKATDTLQQAGMRCVVPLGKPRR